MTGLSLSRAGFDVTMLERSGPSPRCGAALGLVGVDFHGETKLLDGSNRRRTANSRPRHATSGPSRGRTPSSTASTGVRSSAPRSPRTCRTRSPTGASRSSETPRTSRRR
ncbi:MULTISPECIES: hypothetical protein [Streptomyces]|uniref:hypothetical protein n=1 Tax=Streptomyces TaxID=1883 RepID=UPI00142E258B